jgi:hypothetical protein
MREYVEYFVVQKITNWENTGVGIIICAGTSRAATAAALSKLADWCSLHLEYGLDPVHRRLPPAYARPGDDRLGGRPSAAPARRRGVADREARDPPPRLGEHNSRRPVPRSAGQVGSCGAPPGR